MKRVEEFERDLSSRYQPMVNSNIHPDSLLNLLVPNRQSVRPHIDAVPNPVAKRRPAQRRVKTAKPTGIGLPPSIPRPGPNPIPNSVRSGINNLNHLNHDTVISLVIRILNLNPWLNLPNKPARQVQGKGLKNLPKSKSTLSKDGQCYGTESCPVRINRNPNRLLGIIPSRLYHLPLSPPYPSRPSYWRVNYRL